ncbi:hypothetical protein [Halosimplex pelagicum]|uniref:Capsule polysaccharide biosynthesis protein n=1 Tax=Halosimplex pelagicum TaxID=869886 RepID=A0A7D5TRD1_9EURY|nr:hypothetical protein [Halosimplex pelagicum]QLH81212.1 hypothetical protein HZS54_05960 [Halosimplex pelagicum]
MKHNLLQLAARAGYGQDLIGIYDLVTNRIESGFAYDNSNLEIGIDDEKDGTILFPHVPKSTHTQVYALIGEAFSRVGYKPVFVICDGCQPMCTLKDINKPSDPIKCETCQYGATATIKQAGHETIILSDLLPEDKVYKSDDFEKEYRGVDINRYALASTRKATKKYHLASKDDWRIYDYFIESSVKIIDVMEKLFQTRDIVATIANDDKYTQGGIPLEIAERHGVPAYSDAYGWLDGTLLISRISDRDSLPYFERTELVNEFLSQELTENQRRSIKETMRDRMRGNKNMRVHYSATTNNSINPKKDEFVVGMFTNLIWDASLEVADCPFPDPFEWISATIDALAEQESITLIIKTHPAENIRGTNESVENWIRDHWDPLPENIEVLSPETEINTYEMIQDLDAGIVYNSTVGLEMAYLGKPVIVGGKTHYKHLNITHDPETSSEYQDLVRNISELEDDEKVKMRATRYLYFLFNVKHLDFPYIQMTKEGNVQAISSDDPAGLETLEAIVRQCPKGEPVFSSQFKSDLADSL